MKRRTKAEVERDLEQAHKSLKQAMDAADVQRLRAEKAESAAEDAGINVYVAHSSECQPVCITGAAMTDAGYQIQAYLCDGDIVGVAITDCDGDVTGCGLVGYDKC